MPKSKRPRKAYNPHKLAGKEKRPSVDEAYRIFQPVRAPLEQMRSGSIEAVRGYPVFKDWTGEWCRIDLALLGWVDCWERFETSIDQTPLRTLHKRLSSGTPITEEELEAAIAVVDKQQAAFIRLPVGMIKSKTKTEQIAIAMDERGLTT